jgi:hypothetical protein
METRISPRGHFLRLLLFVLVTFCLSQLVSASPAPAANPDVSRFTKNLSAYNPPGETWDDYYSEIKVSGNYVHILWVSRKTDYAEIRICYARSTNGGGTFEAPRVLFSLVGNPADFPADPALRMMAVDGASVHVAYSRSFPISAERSWYYNLYYIRSTDNGGTFTTPRKVFAGKDNWSLRGVRIAASNGKVTIGYNYFANGYNNYSIRTQNSNDGGATFIQTVAANSTIFAGSLQDLVRVGDDVYLLYYWITEPYWYSNFQAKTGVAASNDGGSTFKRTLLTTPATDGRYYAYVMQGGHYSPNLAVAGANVYAVWTQNLTKFDSNNVALFLRRSTDKGVTFGPPKKLATNGSGMGNLQLGFETVAAQGNYVYAVFLTTDSRVYLRRSSDGGASFSALQELTLPGISYLQTGWWPLVQTDPVVANGSKVHVLFHPATYLVSTNGGAKFTRQGLLTPQFTWFGTPSLPQMALSSTGKVHLSMEGRFVTTTYGGWGDWDIFYRRFPTAPELNPFGTTPKALKLAANSNDGIFGNMQVAASPSISLKTALTAEAWIKPKRNADTSGYFLFKADPGKLGAWGSYMLGQWRNGQLDARIATTDNGYVLVNGPAIPNDQWTHVAMTYNSAATGNNFKIYVNGELAGEMAATGQLATQDGLLFVGADNVNHYYSEVQVRELRLWKVARTQTAIKNNMNKTLTGSEPNLSALYNFEDTTRDRTPNGNHGVLMYKESFVAQ